MTHPFQNNVDNAERALPHVLAERRAVDRLPLQGNARAIRYASQWYDQRIADGQRLISATKACLAAWPGIEQARNEATALAKAVQERWNRASPDADDAGPCTRQLEKAQWRSRFCEAEYRDAHAALHANWQSLTNWLTNPPEKKDAEEAVRVLVQHVEVIRAAQPDPNTGRTGIMLSDNICADVAKGLTGGFTDLPDETRIALFVVYANEAMSKFDGHDTDARRLDDIAGLAHSNPKAVLAYYVRTARELAEEKLRPRRDSEELAEFRRERAEREAREQQKKQQKSARVGA